VQFPDHRHREAASRLGLVVEELSDEQVWMTRVSALPIRQGLTAAALVTLSFKEEDGQRSHQGEVACRGGMADLAMVLALGAVAAEVLFGFDGPASSSW
jgi:hypothetical protein